jgi:hypothetical protein
MVHTCATIDGQPWHGALPLSAPMLLQVDTGDTGPSLSLDATIPLALRADDAQCSAFSLAGSVSATASAVSP